MTVIRLPNRQGPEPEHVSCEAGCMAQVGEARKLLDTQ